MRQTKMLLVLIALLLLAACGPAATPPAQPTAEGAYPAPTQGAEGAYPPPAVAPTTDPAYPAPSSEPIVNDAPLVIPQPASNEVGVVHGVLLRITLDNTQEPIRNGLLYLGVPVALNDGQQGLIELDKNVAPYAQANALGQFVFTNVPPGRYGLMYETAEGAVLLHKPDGSGDLLIDVVGGQTIDLGNLAYPLP